MSYKPGWDAAADHAATENAINGLVKCNGSGSYSAVTDNSANWNTAYGWGDHSSVGYFVVGSDTLDDITDGVTYGKPTLAQIGNWDALVSFPGFSDLTTDYGFTDNSSDWDTAYGWGDHAQAGYFIKSSDDLDDIAAGTTNVHLTTTLKTTYDAAASHVNNTTDPHGATATPTASSIVMSAASGRLSWGWAPTTMCCLFLPSNQSTESGSWIDLAFHDGAELIDDGLHNDDVSGAYTRITIAASGYYRFTCRATFAGVATGVRSIRLKKNGATLASSGPNITATASDTTLEINQIHYCSASDYYQMQTYHDRGSNLNVLGGGEYTVFQCVRVR